MEGRKRGKESELNSVMDSGQERSFLELLCEADPSMQKQALEYIPALYQPGFLSCSLTQHVSPPELPRFGEDTQNELISGSSSHKTSKAKKINAVGADKIKMKGQKTSRKSESKFSTGYGCREIKSHKTKSKKDLSWFNVNMKKDNLKGRIAELHELVNEAPAKKPSIVSVLQETKESIVSLLDELKVLSSFYMQHPETSSHLHVKEDRWADGLTSRGLCLVPLQW